MSGPVPGLLGFSYEFAIDIDTAYNTPSEATPVWSQVAFITNAGDTDDKNMTDAATYFDKGSTRQVITGESWTLVFDHQVQRNADGTFITVLDKFVQAAKFGRRNKNAKVHVRWYDALGANVAWSGYAYVAISRANRGNQDIASYTITLTGDGAPTEIVNPVLPTAIATISAATPTGQTVGLPVLITGTGFTGVVAAGVKFGATASTALTVYSDTSMSATMPAGSAGSANITVVNVIGTSTAFTYTRGA